MLIAVKNYGSGEETVVRLYVDVSVKLENFLISNVSTKHCSMEISIIPVWKAQTSVRLNVLGN
jgi:hypothetical protein